MQKTNQLNYYKVGLFDMEDASNKNKIDRLKELYSEYHFNNSAITIGKQLLSTPFINFQDGSIRPSAADGIWGEINQGKKN